MSANHDAIPTSTAVHAVPGDEVIAAKDAVPTAAAVIMESDTDSSPNQEKKEDYSSQPQDKASLRNFWVDVPIQFTSSIRNLTAF